MQLLAQFILYPQTQEPRVAIHVLTKKMLVTFMKFIKHIHNDVKFHNSRIQRSVENGPARAQTLDLLITSDHSAHRILCSELKTICSNNFFTYYYNGLSDLFIQFLVKRKKHFLSPPTSLASKENVCECDALSACYQFTYGYKTVYFYVFFQSFICFVLVAVI